jgi:hypothetical protein
MSTTANTSENHPYGASGSNARRSGNNNNQNNDDNNNQDDLKEIDQSGGEEQASIISSLVPTPLLCSVPLHIVDSTWMIPSRLGIGRWTEPW